MRLKKTAPILLAKDGDMNKDDTISENWSEYERLDHILLKLKNSAAKRGCLWCKHLHDDGYTCDAFPDRRIPFFFINGTRVHDEPFPGDRGIQFERK